MSRLDPKVQEENRKAFKTDELYLNHKKSIALWLKQNPHIGCLNNGTYYRFENGEQIMVEEFS